MARYFIGPATGGVTGDRKVASKSLGRVASKSLGRIFCTPRGITIARSPTLSIGGSIGRLPFLGTQKIESSRSPSTSPSVAPSVDCVVLEDQIHITIICFLLSRTVVPSVGCVLEIHKKTGLHRSPSTSPTVAPSVECSFWTSHQKGCIEIARSHGASVRPISG